MSLQRQVRHVGDTRTAIAAQLKRPDGTVENLTGKTVKFKMTDDQGNSVVSATATGVIVTDATNGKVQYSPQDEDVDTEGLYYGYFTVDSGGDIDTFPAAKGEFEIRIEADS